MSCVLLWEVPVSLFHLNDILGGMCIEMISFYFSKKPESLLFLTPILIYIWKKRMISQLSTCMETESAQTLGSGFWILDSPGPWPVDTPQEGKVEFLSLRAQILTRMGFTLFPMEYI